MESYQQRLWREHERHPGDRLRLFSALGSVYDARSVLYPGSFVDIAPSFVFDDVTYVDTDRRAARFFADATGVDAIIAAHRTQPGVATWRFIHADYTDEQLLPDGSVDLLLSLYAGFVSEPCSRYLRPGGALLVNPSHGDVAMASLDERYSLVGVVTHGAGQYRVNVDNLERYLIPKREVSITRESLHQSGRGIAYTKSPFAYVYERRR